MLANLKAVCQVVDTPKEKTGFVKVNAYEYRPDSGTIVDWNIVPDMDTATDFAALPDFVVEHFTSGEWEANGLRFFIL